MKRLLVLFVLASCTLPVLAQTAADQAPATDADVRQMFAVFNTRQMLDAMLPAVKQQMPEMILANIEKQMPNLTDEQKQILAEYAAKSADNTFKDFPLEAMMSSMVPIYRKYFTHGDIQQIIAFYQSPVGKKLLDNLPAITSEGMTAAQPVMQEWMTKQMDQAQRDALEMAEKMQAATAPKPPAKNTTPAPKK